MVSDQFTFFQTYSKLTVVAIDYRRFVQVNYTENKSKNLDATLKNMFLNRYCCRNIQIRFDSDSCVWRL